MIDHRLSRRQALLGMSSVTTALLAAPWSAPAREPLRSRLGLVIYSCALRRRARMMQNPKEDLFEPLTFLRHCHAVGAAGMQAALGVLDRDHGRTLRAYAEQHGLFLEGIVHPPRDETDVARFEAEMRTAVEVGALAVRTVIIPGRRYEQFKTLAEFREAAERGRRMLELARPVVEKHRVKLAVENHKDQRLDEQLALYDHLKCEYIGACVDTGNNVALLDNPYDTVEALAPYAFTVHLKDQAVREYDEGFLLGDIPLGQGCLDLQRMVAVLRKAKPNVRFVLELITRDALRVPCLTEGYWATMPHVPARDLARTLRWVRQQPVKELPQVNTLAVDKQVTLEDANIAQSLRYAREQLSL